MFNALDKDNSGAIDIAELRSALRNMNLELTDENVALLLRRIDKDVDSDLSFAEFQELLKILYSFKRTFRESDSDNSGSIDRKELEACFRKLGVVFSPLLLSLFEEIFDADKSGSIDYQEFFGLFFYFRELEDTYRHRGGKPDWARYVIGPDASVEEQASLMGTVDWNKPFDTFAKLACTKRLEAIRRKNLERSASALATPGGGLHKWSTESRISGARDSSPGSVQIGRHNTVLNNRPGAASTVSTSTPASVTPGSTPGAAVAQQLGPSDEQIKSWGVVSEENWSKRRPRAVTKWETQTPGPHNPAVITDGHNVEFGAAVAADAPIELDDADKFNPFYKDNIAERTHIDLVALSDDAGPYIISVEEKPERAKAIIRSKKDDERLLISFGRSSLEEELRRMKPELAKATMWRVVNPDLKVDLMAFEQKLIPRAYKFGVLLRMPGQTDETQWYNNQKSTPELDEFLDSIAYRVKLRGWTRYRGGLNVREGLTGEESYYTNYHGYEVMFHVSTMIPYYPNDAQQVERKRHLGNDVVVLVFQDPRVTEPFDPRIIKSQFNHVFVIVQPVLGSRPTQYKIAILHRQGVAAYGPVLPVGPLVKGERLKELLLAKLINAERAAMYAPDFKGKGVRTREAMLRDTIERYPDEKVARKGSCVVEKTGGFFKKIFTS